MNEQPQLPLSHSHGPQTSHDAEAKYTESGKLTGDRARVLKLHRRWPGRTCQELFELCLENDSAAIEAEVYAHHSVINNPVMIHSALIRAAVRSYAILRETIKKRTTDLWNLGHLERRKDSKGNYLTSNGAIRYWPKTK